MVGRGGSVHIVAIEGEADTGVARFPHTWVNWGQVGRMVSVLRTEADAMVIAGSVRRPDLWKLRPDWGFFLSMPQILGMMAGGDDSVLSRVVRFFEAKGIAVRGAHEVAPDLLALAGPAGALSLDRQGLADAELGFAVRAALGPLDAGQAVAVADGRVLAIEGAEGTDAMLARVAALRGATDGARRSGVLAKGPKPGQELRVDMPAVGPRTVEAAAAAGIAGIAIEADAVLLLDRGEAVQAADAHGIAIEGLPNPSPQGGGESRRVRGQGSLPTIRVVGRLQPDARAAADIDKGLAAVELLAQFGTGNAVVVSRAYILAIAAPEPVFAMLERTRALRQWGVGARRRIGVLACRAGPAEWDAPGVTTLIAQAAAQGLAGIAVTGPAAGLGRVRGRRQRRRPAGPVPGALPDAGRAPMTDAPPIAERKRSLSPHGQDLCLFLVAGEHSGDILGGKLMEALNVGRRGRIRYLGVGGPHMAAQGLVSQFPLDEVAVMGLGAILSRLPLLLRRIAGTASAAIAAEPNAVVIVDSPEFTHPIAKRVRRRRPDIPIIDYVSPSVWAWRPGRARKMRGYIDHVLGLWPFEPEVHVRLGGPPCSFVGHPLIERHAWLTALDPAPLARRLGLSPGKPVLVVLPGSRTSEVSRLMQPFGQAMAKLHGHGLDFEAVLPAVASVRGMIERHLAAWPVRPHLVEGDEDKFRAFKLATAALAASGTVTLELALAGTPTVVAYKVDPLIAPIVLRLIKAPSVVLPNLVLGEKVYPEFIQEACTPANLADALAALLADTPERAAQRTVLAGMPAALQVSGQTPSEAAAAIVLDYAENGRKVR